MSLKPKHIDVAQFEKRWESMEKDLSSIIELNGVQKIRWFDVYQDIYDLCTAHPNPHQERVYKKLKKFIQDHVNNIRERIDAQQSDILSVYHQEWERFLRGSMYLDQIFGYVNKHYVMVKKQDEKVSAYSSQKDNLMECGALALYTWKTQLLYAIKERLLSATLRYIEMDRDGKDVPSTMVRSVVSSYVKLNRYLTNHEFDLYNDEFERPFLTATADYYRRESTSFIEKHDIISYMKKAEQRLHEEDVRATKFIEPTSHRKVMKVCETEMIEEHSETMRQDFLGMIKREENDNLRRLIVLLKRIDHGIDPLLVAFQQYVTEIGQQKIRGLGDQAYEPRNYVDALLEVHSKYTGMVDTALGNDPGLVAAIDKACRTVINDSLDKEKPLKSPELLAKYCDQLLRKGSKHGMDHDQIEEALGQLVKVFKYVDDKDIFQKFYSKLLAKRLIAGLSVSDEAEERMISLLKQACGYEYTSKLQRMFTDMSVSSDVTNEFNDFVSDQGVQLGFNFSVSVLQTGAWPLAQASAADFKIPSALQQCVQLFNEFYNKKYNGRKISWLHHLSKGEIRANFAAKRYDFQVTNYQMGILLMYNDGLSYRKSVIRDTLQLEGSELDRSLTSLLDVKLLVVDEKGTEADPMYNLNLQFNNKRTKIKITTAQLVETKKENKATHQAVEQDRKLAIQAAIVRIMKTRKEATHKQLIQEVSEQLMSRFTPNIPMIKKCIEDLIEKAYLERVEDGRDRYRYLA
eukprot:Clim_evm147s157 gene=Clim_evmTU147s157